LPSRWKPSRLHPRSRDVFWPRATSRSPAISLADARLALYPEETGYAPQEGTRAYPVVRDSQALAGVVSRSDAISLAGGKWVSVRLRPGVAGDLLPEWTRFLTRRSQRDGSVAPGRGGGNSGRNKPTQGFSEPGAASPHSGGVRSGASVSSRPLAESQLALAAALNAQPRTGKRLA
jgi:hypothetical protein